MLKRDYFRHEDEVRLICVDVGESAAKDQIRYFPISPEKLFTEIAFDPRLIAFERLERERTARQLGYTGKFIQDYSYQGTLYQIIMKDGWRD